MKQYIEIKNLAIDRDLDQVDDLSDLTKSIKKLGLQVPILVNPQLELVDGLRRVRALQQLGEEFVDSVVVQDLDELVKFLSESRLNGNGWRKPTPRRIWHLHRSSALYLVRRLYENRQRFKGLPAHSKLDSPLPAARMMLANALGYPSESYFGASVAMYNIAIDQDDPRQPLASELVAKVDAEEFSIYAARQRLEREVRFQGNSLSPGEQRTILQNLVHNLAGMVKSTQNMGTISSRIPKRELEAYLKDLKDLRNQLYAFVRTFEKEITK